MAPPAGRDPAERADARKEPAAVDAEELKQRIAAFPSWNYSFELADGVSTPVASAWRVERQQQRRRYFFEPLLGILGGSLRGRRVLDLGCNAGFWSLEALEAGADFVLGVDGSASAIEQAELVFDARGVDSARYRFEHANVFGWSPAERFDVVLCLGLLDVVAKPLALFELIAAAAPDLVVIDTGISRARGELFEVARMNEPRNAIEHDLVLLPTRRAVTALAGRFGLRAVALAHGLEPGELGVEDYLAGRRIAFVCSSGPSLEALDAAPEPPANPWLGAVAGAAARARRRLQG
jgi:2-polyprenyl-3-methyl-5-hydroxy-6-metoxy-1,4-benzoquinol methylase